MNSLIEVNTLKRRINVADMCLLTLEITEDDQHGSLLHC
jgi:hypothetical protein